MRSRTIITTTIMEIINKEILIPILNASVLSSSHHYILQLNLCIKNIEKIKIFMKIL